MPSCAVFGCLNSSRTNRLSATRVSFITFPKDAELCSVWMKLCRQANGFNPRTARICSEHFLPSDSYVNLQHKLVDCSPSKSSKIRPGCLPSLNLPDANSVRTPEDESKRDRRRKWRLVDKISSAPSSKRKRGGMATPSSDDFTADDTTADDITTDDITTDDITTDQDLFYSAVKAEADVDQPSPPAFASVFVTDGSVDYEETLPPVDAVLPPLERVLVDESAVKTEPNIDDPCGLRDPLLMPGEEPPVGTSARSEVQPNRGSREEGGGVSPRSPALGEKEIQGQSIEPPLKLPFKCNMCLVGFPDKQLFLRHVLMHIGLPPAKCPHCPAAFKTAGELEQHLLGHSSERDGAASGGASPSGEPPGAGGSLDPPSVGRSGSKPAEVPPRRAPLLVGKSPPTVGSETLPSVPPPPSGSPAKHARPARVRDPPYKSGAFKCRATGCGRRYGAARSLRRHSRVHGVVTPPPDGVYPCPVAGCGKRYRNEGSLQRHGAVHTGATPHACAACPRRFAHAGGLAVHRRSHRDHVGPFECPACGRRFPKRWGLVVHARMHTGERPYACPVCARTFAHRGGLNVHSLLHAQGGARFPCDRCGRRYRQASALACHARTHDAPWPHACAECGRRFERKNGLTAHAFTHVAEKPHACEQCGKRFHTRGRLAAHALVAHVAVKPYLCETCGRCFSHKSSLVAHAATHAGERPLECDTCGARFAIETTLELHRRTHAGEMPYECYTCGRRFAIETTLELHRRTHAGETPHECAVPTCGETVRAE